MAVPVPDTEEDPAAAPTLPDNLFADVPKAETTLPDDLFADVPKAKATIPDDIFADVPKAPGPLNVKDELSPVANAYALGLGEELLGLRYSLERGGRQYLQSKEKQGIERATHTIDDEIGAAKKRLAQAEEFFKTEKYPSERFIEMDKAQYRHGMNVQRAEAVRDLDRLTKEKATYQERLPELAQAFSEQQAALEKLPRTTAQIEFQKPETPWWKFFSNPVELSLLTTAESAPSMVEGMVGGIAGPAGLAVTTGYSSFQAESSARTLNAMAEAGVDLKDPKEVLAWFNDRAKSDPALAKADLAALGPAAFDALTAGIAGKLLHRSLGKGPVRVGAATAGEVGIQMAGGGLGSIAGNLLAGEKIDWKDVVLEMAAEVAPVEAVENVMVEKARQNHLNATARVLESLEAFYGKDALEQFRKFGIKPPEVAPAFKSGDEVAYPGGGGIIRGVVQRDEAGNVFVKVDKWPDVKFPLHAGWKPSAEVLEPEVTGAPPMAEKDFDELIEHPEHIDPEMKARTFALYNELRAQLARRGIHPDTSAATHEEETSLSQQLSGSLTRVGRQQLSIDKGYKRGNPATRDDAIKQLQDVWEAAEKVLGRRPKPETAESIAKQIEITNDPKSTKSVTLVTPGTPLPADLGGLASVETKHGVALYNPHKVSRADVVKAGEGHNFDGRLLGFSQQNKPEPVGDTVVQTTHGGQVVLDEVVENTPEAIAKATAAHAAAVPGGETKVRLADEILAEREKKGKPPVSAPTPTTPKPAAPTAPAPTPTPPTSDVAGKPPVAAPKATPPTTPAPAPKVEKPAEPKPPARPKPPEITAVTEEEWQEMEGLSTFDQQKKFGITQTRLTQARMVLAVNLETLAEGKFPNGQKLTAEDRARLEAENAQWRKELTERPTPPPPEPEKPAKPAKAKKPAAKAPEGEASVWTRIGFNARGNPVFEDQHGVRSYTEKGIRVTEPVGIIPGGGIEVPTEHGSSYMPVGGEPTPTGRAAAEKLATDPEYQHLLLLMDQKVEESVEKEIQGYLDEAEKSKKRSQIKKRREQMAAHQAKMLETQRKLRTYEGKDYGKRFERAQGRVIEFPTREAAQQHADSARPANPEFDIKVERQGPKAFQVRYELNWQKALAAKEMMERDAERAQAPKPKPEAPKLETSTGLEGQTAAELERLAREGTRAERELAAREIARRKISPATESTATTVPTTGQKPSREEIGVRPGEKPATPPAAPAPAPKPAGLKGLNEAENARLKELQAKLRKKLGQTGSGPDPEVIVIGAEMAGLYVKSGVRQFSEFARKVKQDLPEIWDSLKQHLKSIWESAAVANPELDEPSRAEVAATLAQIEAEPAETGVEPEAETEEAAPTDETKPGVGETDTSGERPLDETGTPPTPTEDAGDREDVEGKLPETGEAPTGRKPSGRGGKRAGRPGVVAGPEDAGGIRGGEATGGEGTTPEQPGVGTGVSDPDHNDLGRENYHLTDPEAIVGGGPKTRFNKNQTAIETFEAILNENREPTTPELDRLAAFTGWGSFGQELFNGTWANPEPKEGWEVEDAWLREHLGEAQWKSAQRSIINAHYTDPVTVTSMWNMLERMGFKGGRVLEPSMGVGNFFSLMKRATMAISNLTGIELDKMTGRIAQMLHPRANVQIKGYEESRTADNFYDVVIGNWPFADVKPADRRYNHLDANLHDYFFLKAIDQVKPGGIVIGITSTGTMDKKSPKIRRYIAARAELVQAFRLPSGTFGKYAGTNVVTDLMIFRKRETKEPNPTDAWIDTHEVKMRDGKFNLNNYYRAHPENIIGELGFGRGTTTGRPGMIVTPPKNHEQVIRDLYQRVPENIFKAWEQPNDIQTVANTDSGARQLSIVERKGELYQVQGEQLVVADTLKSWRKGSAKQTSARLQEAKDAIAIRTALDNLLNAYRSGDNTEAARAKLRMAYQSFVNKHGKVRDSFMLRYMEKLQDSSARSVVNLEDENGNPREVLERDVMRKKPPTTAEGNIDDAFAIQRNNSLTFSLEDTAKLADATQEETKARLIELDQIYQNPTGVWEARDQYLEGNVRRKLREAIAAQEQGMDMKRNIEALERVMPKDIPHFNIETRMGANWVSVPDYKDFIASLIPAATDEIEVNRMATGWNVRVNNDTATRSNEARVVWGHEHSKAGIAKILEAAMNGTLMRIYDDTDDGPQFNEKVTEQVNGKIEAIRDQFQKWIWEDAGRTARLTAEYNEVANSLVTPQRDGSYLRLEGLALKLGDTEFDFRKHQRDAVARGTQDGKGMFAHEVGTGKTFTMAGMVMEGRRLGVFRKPIVFAHNANSASVRSDFQAAYPSGKFLYLDSLTPDEIQARLRQIALDDWDAVIVPHSLIDRFTLSEETMMELARDEIQALEDEIRSVMDDIGGQDYTQADLDDLKEFAKKVKFVPGGHTAKALVKQRLRIIERIRKKSQETSRENAVLFEELGIDAILVDEAHEFKKISLATRKQIKGLSKEESGRGFALSLLSDYVKRQNDGKGIFFFTGTPVTNTLNEVYNMMRYVMSSDMTDAGLQRFDDWFNMFADTESEVEMTEAGTYEAVDRLRAFINVSELARMAGRYFDVVFAKDMPEFKNRESREGMTQNPVGRPFKEVVPVSLDLTPEQQAHMQTVRERFARWKAAGGKQRRQMMMEGRDTPLQLNTETSLAALDYRLVDKDAPDHPLSKVNLAVTKILDLFREHPQTTQMVFMEQGYNDYTDRTKKVRNADGTVKVDADGNAVTTKERIEKFNLVRDMVTKLIAGGVKPEEIAIFANMKLYPMTAVPNDPLRKVLKVTNSMTKEDLSQLMREGKIKVAFGQTKTMGTGVNAQTYLRAMHHLDAPWTPGEMEQRNGRGWRQGNKWNLVLEHRYFSEGGGDGKRWQFLLNKVRFIERFMKALATTGADQNLRTLEGDGADASEENERVSDFEASFGAAAGDPRQLLKAGLAKKIRKLEIKQDNHAAGIRRAFYKINEINSTKPRREEVIANREKDTAAFNELTAAPFQIEIEGKPYTERKDADEAFKRVPVKPDLTTIGHWGQFEIQAMRDGIFVKGPSGIVYSASPSVGSIAGNLRHIATYTQQLKDDLARDLESIPKLMEMANSPFTEQDKLNNTKLAMRQLEAEIALSPFPAPSWLRNVVPMGSSIYLKQDGKLVAVDVAAHRWDSNNWWVLYEDLEGQMRPVPYTEVLDETGAPMIQPRPFEQPPTTRPQTTTPQPQPQPPAPEDLTGLNLPPKPETPVPEEPKEPTTDLGLFKMDRGPKPLEAQRQQIMRILDEMERLEAESTHWQARTIKYSRELHAALRARLREINQQLLQQQKGGTNASGIESTTADDGGMRTQPGTDEGQLPLPQGGAGVQPREEPTGEGQPPETPGGEGEVSGAAPTPAPPATAPAAPPAGPPGPPTPPVAGAAPAAPGGGTPVPPRPPKIVTPKSQSQIIRDLAKGLGIPIRFGRLRTNKFGGYFLKLQNLIGVKRPNNMPVTTHEVGHKLDAMFDFSKMPTVRPELDKLGDPTTPGSLSSWTPSKTNAYKMREGVAEFVRHWLTDPAHALATAPNMYRAFEGVLNANKDLNDFLRQVQSDIKTYKASDPQARLRSKISTTNPNQTRYTFSQFTRDFVDDLHFLRLAADDVKKLTGKALTAMKNPYLLARLLRGSFGMAESFIKYGTADYQTRNVNMGTSYEDAIKPVAGRLDDFRDWIVAKRAQELRDQGRETGLTDDEIDVTAARFDGDTVFEKAFDDLKKWQNALLQYAVDAGLVDRGTPRIPATASTPEMAPTGSYAIREMNQDYVPFHRVFEVGAGESPALEGAGTGRGLNVGKPGSLRRLTGSFRDIVDPLETMVKNAYSIITAAEKAAINVAVADLSRIEGMGKWVEHVATPKEAVRLHVEKVREQLERAGANMTAVPDDLLLQFFRDSQHVPFGENIIKVVRNGQAEFYRLDRDLFATFHALDLDDVGMWVKMVGAPTQWLRAGVTLAPDFALRNMIKDAIGSSITSRYGLLPFEALVKGMRALAFDKDVVASWLASGGRNAVEANFFDRDKLQAYMREKILSMSPAERVWSVVTSPLQALRWASALSEEATRIGEYKNAYDTLVRQGVPEADARRMAAYESRDRQDFAKGGAKTKILRRWVAFANAGLQGNVRLAQAFRERPFQTFMKGFMFITVAKLLEQSLNWDDDDYWQRPQWERDMFYMIPLGKGADGHTKFLRLPVPFLQGVIFATLPGRMLQAYKHSQKPETTHEPTLGESWPMVIVKETVPNPIPHMAVIMGEVAAGEQGYDFYRGRPIVQESVARLPAGQEFTAQTSVTARKVGGLLGLSPMKIDFVINQSTGGLGKQITHQVLDRIMAAATGEKRTAQSTAPFTGFVSTPAAVADQSIEDFYSTLHTIKEATASEKQGGPENAMAEEWSKSFLKAEAEMNKLRRKMRESDTDDDKQFYAEQILQLAREQMRDFRGERAAAKK